MSASRQIVERQILAPLRHQTFFSLASLNRALAESLTTLNQRPFQKLDGSRASWFAEEKSVLRPLPAQRYPRRPPKLLHSWPPQNAPLDLT